MGMDEFNIYSRSSAVAQKESALNHSNLLFASASVRSRRNIGVPTVPRLLDLRARQPRQLDMDRVIATEAPGPAPAARRPV